MYPSDGLLFSFAEGFGTSNADTGATLEKPSAPSCIGLKRTHSTLIGFRFCFKQEPLTSRSTVQDRSANAQPLTARSTVVDMSQSTQPLTARSTVVDHSKTAVPLTARSTVVDFSVPRAQAAEAAVVKQVCESSHLLTTAYPAKFQQTAL